MKIGVISDTHDNKPMVLRAVQILRERSMNAVFHLGDFVAPFTLKLFEGFKLYGVFGNNDGERILLKKVAEELGFVLDDGPVEIELGGKHFLLMHGSGSVEKTKKIAESLAKSSDYDFVLYGHTHQRDLRNFGSTILINPGEACGYLGDEPSMVILDTESGVVNFVYL